MKVIKLNKNEIRFFYSNENEGLITEYTFDEKDSLVKVGISVKNISGKDIYPGNYHVFEKIEISHPQGYTKPYVDCKDMLGWIGPQSFDKEWNSYSTCGLVSENHYESILMGFDNLKDNFYNFILKKENEKIIVKPVCPFEHTKIKPGETRNIANLVFLDEGSLQKSFETYGEIVTDNMGKFDKSKKTPSGYCTWYTYYGTEKSSDLYRVTDELSKTDLKNDIEYILIDDGWNNTLEAEKSNWGDWDAKTKYPEGMEKVAGYIHSKGFKAGLWLAPFCVTNNSEIYRNNPEWILGLGEDLLNNGGEVYGLDLTHPGVQKFIENTFEKVFYDWGFDFVKIDFLLYGALETNKRYNQDMTSAQAFRKGIEIINGCKGPDKMVLQCGSPLLQSVGCPDTMRIGSDLGSQWFFPLNDHMWQYGNCSIKPAMRYTIYHHWMHNNLWFNDPDCIVGRSSSNGIEYEEFSKWFPGMIKDESQFGLSRDEMFAWIKLVWITGGARFLSENLEILEPERKEIIKSLFSAKNESSVLIDDYKNDDIAVFKTRDDDSKIAIFNLSDEKVNYSVPSEMLGIKNWNYKEITEDIILKGSGDEIVFPQMPPRSGYIYIKDKD